MLPTFGPDLVSAQLRSAVRRGAITHGRTKGGLWRSQFPHRPEAAEACVRRPRALASDPRAKFNPQPHCWPADRPHTCAVVTVGQAGRSNRTLARALPVASCLASGTSISDKLLSAV